MPTFSPLQICNVTKGKRVTLPPIVDDIQYNDQLAWAKCKDGYFVRKIDNIVSKEKIKLWGIEIGQCVGNGRWYGIIVDQYGIIKARISASTQQYLYKDLVEVTDLKTKTKLNEKCGINNWERPILISAAHVDKCAVIEGRTCAVNTAKECLEGLKNGTWPPSN